METIYGLCDPLPLYTNDPDIHHPKDPVYWWKYSLAKRIRYIRITDNIYRRFAQHLLTEERGNRRKSDWLRTRKAQQVMIQCQILQQVETRATAQIREEYWISYYHYLGARLLNTQKYKWLPSHELLDYVIDQHHSNLRDPALQKIWLIWSHVRQDEAHFIMHDLARAAQHAAGLPYRYIEPVLSRRTSSLSWYELFEQPMDSN